MRILFVCNEFPPVRHGGIGIFVKTLAVALVQLGHQVHVIGFDPERAEDASVSIDGVNILWLKIPRFPLRHKILQALYERYHLSRRLKALSDALKPDIVESYDWSGPLLFRPRNTKFVVRLHGANSPNAYNEGKKISRFLYFLEKRNIRMADGVTAVSDHIARITLACFRLKTNYTVLYNPVDCTVFKPLQEIRKDGRLMLYVGRLDERKGLEELMLAFNFACEHNNEIKLEVVGAGKVTFHEKLLTLLTNEARKRVVFSGRIDHKDLPGKYTEACVAVLPSRAEAFGITAIEAMACGTPVLITKRASGPEIITHQQDGWIVDTFDASGFGRTILEAFADGKQTAQLGLAARQTALAKFDLRKIVEDNISFYQRLEDV